MNPSANPNVASPQANNRSSLWVAAAVVVATLVQLGAQTTIVARTGFLMGDFRAFYCAARVASHGADPYLAQPLRACEVAAAPTQFFKKNPGVTIPAPLPGYAIAALVPLSFAPFAVAAAIWSALLLLAWLACIVALARFAQAAWPIALAVVGLSLGVLSLPFGEVVPLALAFLCLAACRAWQRRWRAAALFAAAAMIEPHLALPACIALAIWAPATRWPLVLSAAVLGALSLAFLGPATNLEYFTSVLPSHALSEATRDTQYSLTGVLSSMGTPASVALRAGTGWYLAMLALGAVIAGRLTRKTGNAAFLVCAPLAFAVFGGTFIHITQIAAALPAALLSVSHAKQPARNFTVAALLALAVPWGWVVSPALILAPAVPVGFLAWRYWGENLSAVLLAALAAALLVFGLGQLYTVHSARIATYASAPAIDARLAEASWSEYSRAGSGASLAAWAVRLPTWLGLALLLGLLAGEARAVEAR